MSILEEPAGAVCTTSHSTFGNEMETLSVTPMVPVNACIFGSVSDVYSTAGSVGDAREVWTPMTHRDIRPLRDIVKEHILTALELSHWRTGRAALALGITQRHIYNKIREYGIDLEETRKQAKLKLTGKSF